MFVAANEQPRCMGHEALCSVLTCKGVPPMPPKLHGCRGQRPRKLSADESICAGSSLFAEGKFYFTLNQDTSLVELDS